MSDWQFSDPPDTVAVTSSDLANGRKPILYVSHEVDEENEVMWQFHDDPNDFDFSTAALVRLDTMLRVDNTIAELAGLGIGFEATRAFVGGEWKVNRMPSPT